jgi:hypothetical protein
MTKSAYHLALASLVVLASLLAQPAASQETQRPPNAIQPAATDDSLPFRRGQWGAEFGIDDGTVGIGVLRFRSPRKAWLIDGAVSAAWSDAESSFSGDDSRTSVFVRVRTGPRSYRVITAGSAGYLGMGLSAGYGWAATTGNRYRSWDAGAFSELGAIYLVTRRLSLGAQIEIYGAFSWSHQRYADPPEATRDRRLSIGVRPPRIVGALYF